MLKLAPSQLEFCTLSSRKKPEINVAIEQMQSTGLSQSQVITTNSLRIPFNFGSYAKLWFCFENIETLQFLHTHYTIDGQLFILHTFPVLKFNH